MFRFLKFGRNFVSLISSRANSTASRSSNLNHVTIRRATRLDYYGILGIPAAQSEEEDRLYGTFVEYLAYPHRSAYVATDSDKMVGFVAFNIVDDGETIIREAGRTLPAYRSSGISTRIQNHIVMETRKTNQNLRFLAWMTESEEGHEYIKRNSLTVNATRPRISIVGRREELANQVNAYLAKNHLLRKEVDEIRKLEHHSFPDVLANASAQNLFPGNTIAAGYNGFRDCPSNYQLLTEYFVDIHSSSNAIFSISCSYAVAGGTGHHVDFYGGLENLDSIRSHVFYHIFQTYHMTMPGDKRIFLYFNFPSNEVKSAVLKMLSECLMDRYLRKDMRDRIYTNADLKLITDYKPYSK